MKYYAKCYDDHLSHHGILGQKWGVRRYQNADGTLTSLGKKRQKLLRDDHDITDRDYKNLKRDVRHLKKDMSPPGSGAQFAWSTSTGKYSDAVLSKKKEAMRNAEESKETSEFKKEVQKLDKLWEKGKIDPDEYDSRWEKLRDQLINTDAYKERNKYVGDRVFGYSDRINGYAKEYLENGGKDITIARLRDLGYDKNGAEYVARKLLKTGKVLE